MGKRKEWFYGLQYQQLAEVMPQRKTWSKQQDRILRLLKNERGQKKWSIIAKLMETEFGIQGRTGKQCRQRYHNHLDSTIVSGDWTKRQQEILFQNHETIGNKWSMIAQKLPGRSDNCVKNHFYSKLRKSIRKLNKAIGERFKGQFHEIRISLLYKIIQTTEQKFKLNSKANQEVVNQCNEIKNQLYQLDSALEGGHEQLAKMAKLIQRIEKIQLRLKKNGKKHKISIQTVESRNDIPQLKTIQENILKQEEEELCYYRIIKKVCEEIVASKYH